MYFWRIRELKAEMVERPLSDREVLPYLVVSMLLYSVLACIPHELSDVWDVLGAIWSVLITVLGALYIYFQNGGSEGRHFLQRYFAIGWVVTLRSLVVISLLVVTLHLVLATIAVSQDDLAVYDFFLVAVCQAVVYQRIGHHVSAVARGKRRAKRRSTHSGRSERSQQEPGAKTAELEN